MATTQSKSNNSLTRDLNLNDFRSKNEVIWMNSLARPPRLKKDLSSKFRLATLSPAQSGSQLSDLARSTAFTKSANSLEVPQNPQSVRFLRPNPSIQNPLQPLPSGASLSG